MPAGSYAWLLRAPSKGAYFARMINDCHPYRDVTPVPEGGLELADALRQSLESKP